MPATVDGPQLGRLLAGLAAELDVPPTKYKDAKDRYSAVASWLGASDSRLAGLAPEIYPQGSFALGTAVRPLGTGDFDVDAVCVLQADPARVSQKELKGLVGARLADPRSRYRGMLDPKEGGRRCWTIRYSDESRFHLDILPAVPDDPSWLVALGVVPGFAQHAIQITDKATWPNGAAWPRSNPKGYADWFKTRMAFQIQEAKRVIALERRADVEAIEDYEVRTPLQRLIQILKRHRDMRYDGDEDKPISIIISTLAAASYDNESDLGDALLNVVPRMRRAVQNRSGVYWVANPVNPRENFADKWDEAPRKSDVFFEWLNSVEREHRDLIGSNAEKVGDYLIESYGRGEVEALLGGQTNVPAASGIAAPAILVPRRTAPPEMQRVDLPETPAKPWSRGNVQPRR